MVNASNIISGIIISKNIEGGLKVKHKLLNIVHNCKVNITLSKLAFMKYTLQHLVEVYVKIDKNSIIEKL